MRNVLLRQLAVAGIYIGTIVGAGFATGQEVLRFFTAFTGGGIWGLIMAGVLFSLFGWVILEIGYETKARSHRQVVTSVLGPLLGKILDWLITAILFGVFTFMAAGAGAVFEQQYGLPSWVGSLVIVSATLLTLIFGFSGVIRSIGIFAPLLIVAVFGLATVAVVRNPLTADALSFVRIATPAAPFWPLASVLYVSLNLMLAISILAPLGKKLSRPIVRKGGAVLGGTGLAVTAAAIHVAILATLPESVRVEVPILSVAESISPYVAAIYSGILLAEVYTSAVGSLYGFAARLEDYSARPLWQIAIPSAVVAFILSRFGFTALVETFLPLAGYAGLLLLAALTAWLLKPIYFRTTQGAAAASRSRPLPDGLRPYRSPAARPLQAVASPLNQLQQLLRDWLNVLRPKI